MVKKQKTTLIAFLLDETGSMNLVKNQTIDGFNKYVDTLKKAETPMLMTLTKFNSLKNEVVYSALSVKEVLHLNNETYLPDAATPLYDAVGTTIASVDKELAHKRFNKKAVPNVLCVIMTDGEENSSREYSREQIFKLVKDHEEQGWTFIFLGANQDAWETGASMGLSGGNILSYAVADTASVFNKLASSNVSYAAAATTGKTGNTTNYFEKFYDDGSTG